MKRVPQLRFSVRFDTSEALPDGWSGDAPLELASGPSYSWHGDFINGWLEEAAENMLLATDKREWQYVDGPLKEAPACTAEDADPENGTDDYEESLKSLDSVEPEEVVEIPSAPTASAVDTIPSTTPGAFTDSSALTTTTIAQATASATVVPEAPPSTECKLRKRKSLHSRRRRASA